MDLYLNSVLQMAVREKGENPESKILNAICKLNLKIDPDIWFCIKMAQKFSYDLYITRL